ncbi:MAG: hypothetical protein E6R03_05790 [Hyphomicrobiaceae bacterium]|nr:MAG: hypothetical protein E6R03_05790 [Hyphomicrobiaceae bacterium]
MSLIKTILNVDECVDDIIGDIKRKVAHLYALAEKQKTDAEKARTSATKILEQAQIEAGVLEAEAMMMADSARKAEAIAFNINRLIDDK